MDLLQWPNCLCYIFHIRKYSHFANLHGKILMRKVRKTIVVLSDGVKKHGVCGVWPLKTLYGPAVLAVKFWSNWNFDYEKLVSRSIPSVRIGYACWIVSNRALKLLIPKNCWSVALQLSLHHEISFDGLDSPSHSCTWSVTNSLKTTDNFKLILSLIGQPIDICPFISP